MNFIKLNQNGKPVLVNLDNITEVYSRETVIGSNIYFTSEHKDRQVTISVDETLDEIFEKVNENGESQRTIHNQESDRSIEAPEMQYIRES